MPFGLCNAHATFQILMNRVFKTYIGTFIRFFLDDFCIYRKKENYWGQIEKSFKRLQEAIASLNPTIFIFG